MKKVLLVILGVLFLMGSAGVASATLIDDVDEFLIAHNGNTPTSIGVGDTFNYYGYYEVDIAETSVSLSFLKAWNLTSQPTLTLKISDIEVPSLVGLLGSSSSQASYADGLLSFSIGSSFSAGTILTADLNFGTVDTGGGSSVGDGGNVVHNPIPAPILLLGTGLVGMVGFRRKIKK